MMFRTGDRKNTAIIIEKWSEEHHRNIDIGEYVPKYCPECGRKLFENDKNKQMCCASCKHYDWFDCDIFDTIVPDDFYCAWWKRKEQNNG